MFFSPYLGVICIINTGSNSSRKVYLVLFIKIYPKFKNKKIGYIIINIIILKFTIPDPKILKNIPVSSQVPKMFKK